LSTTQVPYPNYVGLANASALPESTLYVADRDVILIQLADEFHPLGTKTMRGACC
jgi:hypothetical protein